nr:signal peptidase II [Lachnospiraceae bacterium]
MNKFKYLFTDVFIMIILVILDQLSKIWAVNNLMDKEPRILIPGVLQLYYLPNGNSGAAFGILSGHRFLFVVIAIFVVGIIFYVLSKLPVNNKYII